MNDFEKANKKSAAGDIDMYDSKFAEEYTGKRSEFSNTEEYVFGKMKEIDLGGKDILDVGCGDGRHARKMQELGARNVIGIDNSEAMISLAHSNASEHVAFSVAEAGNTGLASESVDMIFSNFVIHYVQDLEPVFAEFNRVLRQGGRVLMTFNIFETDDSSLHNTTVPLTLGGIVVVHNLVKSDSEVVESLQRSDFVIDSYETLDSSYLSIDDSFSNKSKISAIKNILCVARKSGVSSTHERSGM